ncbi:hypothetical protein RYA05_34690 [Pseudomonas syringae pv. actinidiae]|uniref:hypothetical protein n=1 Tax=Pseudomonas syringae TaxID=317 RepID=UPI000357A4E4|nr:hypothetical protein [Pseudomonas syringae]AKT30772.1 hypothetical protein IYO_014845 [Pseudomonas syringae pv. actinidiae ICMP 18884]AOE57189.1 hypothetical protein NZ708_14830 [Pseudomonas syringae pv. actinidiae ICMP 18708]AYL81098.1 hypothetical protein CN228_15110 [Pseudomonas syringae pv. actinidiae str. Shaanxi_M228]EPM64994.1 hypothetical protein A3SM_34590 [Pseudomonas syringae pv. actinidiae ICMP 18886]EPN55339.1 hypothetical protein A235_37626 [Pseudomonas syringae pv. actinidiae
MKHHEVQIDHTLIDTLIVHDSSGNGPSSKPGLVRITDEMTGSLIGAALTFPGSDKQSQIILPRKKPGAIEEAGEGSDEPESTL